MAEHLAGLAGIAGGPLLGLGCCRSLAASAVKPTAYGRMVAQSGVAA